MQNSIAQSVAAANEQRELKQHLHIVSKLNGSTTTLSAIDLALETFDLEDDRKADLRQDVISLCTSKATTVALLARRGDIKFAEQKLMELRFAAQDIFAGKLKENLIATEGPDEFEDSEMDRLMARY